MNPKEINIEVTTLCDAKCIMCPRDEYPFPFKSMNFELFKRVLDDALENGVQSLVICGYGDIFLDKGIEQKLRYAKETSPTLKIFTSSTCSRVSKDKLHLLNYLDTLKISMYGMSKKPYEDVHRGKLVFETVWENIHNILEYRKGRKKPLYIPMNFLILPENEHEVDAWRQYWEPLVDEIQIWRPHNYGSILSETYPWNETIAKRSCGRPFHGEPYVHENGDVSVCCFDNTRELVIGNLAREKLSDLMQSPRLKHIQQVHRDGLFDSSDLICKSCDQVLDRGDALVYSSNSARKVGVLMGHPDMLNDVLGKPFAPVSVK